MTTTRYYDPQTLDEFNYQPLVTNSFKRVIANNLHSINNKVDNSLAINSILITGKPSVGKSVLARIYARSTLCKNRKENSYIGCGKCDICTGKDTTNIFYHTISDLTEARKVIEKFVEESKSLPIAKDVRKDQFRKFFILDECEGGFGGS